MAPDLGEGLTQGTAESFSCINCSEDKLLSESGHYCHRVCQQCILGLAVSLDDQGYKSIFFPCGDQLWSLSSLLTCTDSSFSTKLRAQSQLLRHFS